VETYSYNGHDYAFMQETLTWEQAADCAVSRGGHLAHINSQAEHDSLYTWLSTDPAIDPNGRIDVFDASSIWLGGTDKANEGDWIWDGNNTDVGTSFWSGNLMVLQLVAHFQRGVYNHRSQTIQVVTKTT
jgi:hypothetical protein